MDKEREALQQIADMDQFGLRADDLGRAASIARTALAARASAAPAVPQEPDEFTGGVNAAAALLDKMADDYAHEHSTQDSETGVWEFGRHGEDYYNTLRELADDIRDLVHGNNAAAPSPSLRIAGDEVHSKPAESMQVSGDVHTAAGVKEDGNG